MGQLFSNKPYKTFEAHSGVLIRNQIGQYCFCFLILRQNVNLIGGRLMQANSYFESVIRQIKLETHLDVKLEGILSAKDSIKQGQKRFDIIFYATPIQQDQPLSNYHKWFGYENLEQSKYSLLIEWGQYVEKGKPIRELWFYSYDCPQPNKDSIFTIKQQTSENK